MVQHWFLSLVQTSRIISVHIQINIYESWHALLPCMYCFLHRNNEIDDVAFGFDNLQGK